MLPILYLYYIYSFDEFMRNLYCNILCFSQQQKKIYFLVGKVIFNLKLICRICTSDIIIAFSPSFQHHLFEFGE